MEDGTFSGGGGGAGSGGGGGVGVGGCEWMGRVGWACAALGRSVSVQLGALALGGFHARMFVLLVFPFFNVVLFLFKNKEEKITPKQQYS